MSASSPSSPKPSLSKRSKLRRWQSPAAVAVTLLSACSPTGTHQTRPVSASNPNQAPLPEYLGDPIEPVNRGIWGVNKGVLNGVVRPTSRAYRAVVPTEARKSINHFAHNLVYPGRLINNTLQGRWKGAGDESLRFVTNTTVGVAGFFDVATKWGIPRSDASFGETFYKWGWRPGTYLMLPILGPSDETHTAGTVSDRLADPLTYAYPAPYAITSAATTFNRLSDSAETASRFSKSEADSYAGTKYIWSYVGKEYEPDWTVRGPKDSSTLQTLGAATTRTKDPEFAARTKELSVRIPSTGKKLKFNCWLQKDPSPLVYINPGLGSHRLAGSNLSIAECLFNDGYSVVTTTSVFHPEFMENASTAALPAYPPVDSADMLVALTEIDRSLDRKYPNRFGKRALIGCSMGAYQALYLAANEKKIDPNLIHFDRHVAIATPVSLIDGIGYLDGFQQAPMAWPAAERQALVNNAAHKVAKLAEMPPAQLTDLPFSAVESRFLIGMTFRLTLRDAIYSSQSRNNMGVLQTPISNWKREPVYREILGFSYRDYFEKFVLPYYQSKGVTQQHFRREANLRNFSKGLGGNSKVRVIINSNDFLLSSGDVSWLRSTIGSSRVTVFPNGGHLGNLSSPEVQGAILRSLDGLK